MWAATLVLHCSGSEASSHLKLGSRWRLRCRNNSVLPAPSGLPSEHLPEAAVERPAAGLQRVPRRLARPRPLHVGLHLEARLVLRQREGGQLPRGHHRQQAAANLQKRQRALQHTVSGGEAATAAPRRSETSRKLSLPSGSRLTLWQAQRVCDVPFKTDFCLLVLGSSRQNRKKAFISGGKVLQHALLTLNLHSRSACLAWI